MTRRHAASTLLLAVALTTATTTTKLGDEGAAHEQRDTPPRTTLDDASTTITSGTNGGDDGPRGDDTHEQLDDVAQPLDELDTNATTSTNGGDEGAAGAVDEPWASLADCESGDWLDGGAAFVDESARWRWGAPDVELPPWGTTIHHGGLQFHPDTWSWVAPDVLDDPPAHAYDATPAQQVAVAIETQRRQGWEAWPVCSRLVELR